MHSVLLTLLFVFAICTQSLPHSHRSTDSSATVNTDAAGSTGPFVFAHYMLITRPPSGNYTNDINLAMAAGIDAFAINYGGVDVDWTVQQGYLAQFYENAAALNFKVFLTVDCTSVPNAQMVLSLVGQYATHAAQFIYNGGIMLSSFETTGCAWNWYNDVIKQTAHDIYLVPGSCNSLPSQNFNQGEGSFTWVHPEFTPMQEYAADVAFAAARDNSGGTMKWMAGIAPWFFKRFDPVDNWSNAQDDSVWVDRWLNLLKLKPDFIEIVTWNDWGESSYIGPADTTKSVSSAYWDTLDHSPFLRMAAVFIKAYKAGSSVVQVDPSEEDVFLFYRPQPAMVLGASDFLPLPWNASSLKDNVYVVPFLSAPATVTLNSGGTSHQMSAPVGVSKMQIPWTWGPQSLTAQRNGATFATKTGGPGVAGQLSQYNGNVIAL